MASRDFGDVFDTRDMSDDELRQLIAQQFRENPSLDADSIDVQVRDGFVTLGGRVGTDAEVQIAGEVIADVLGIENYSNELVVDSLRRPDLPEAADEAVTAEAEMDEQVGGHPTQQSDTAAHLQEDLEGETFGTRDMGRAIENGMSYSPPDRPGADGYGSQEDH